jgi:hypothetical protein
VLPMFPPVGSMVAPAAVSRASHNASGSTDSAFSSPRVMHAKTAISAPTAPAASRPLHPAPLAAAKSRRQPLQSAASASISVSAPHGRRPQRAKGLPPPPNIALLDVHAPALKATVTAPSSATAAAERTRPGFRGRRVSAPGEHTGLSSRTSAATGKS